MENKKTIVLTGGGTAGHVMPHLALIPELRRNGWSIVYVGSSGIEKKIIDGAGLPFYEISAGKLRRAKLTDVRENFKNFLDVFRIAYGFIGAFFVLLRVRPKVIFSKGGFVSVPVCYAGWLLRIPVVSHESDYSVGLATRLITPFARKILVTFEDTREKLPASKVICTGSPIREELTKGNAERGIELCEFGKKELPLILVMGGSQGAVRVNQALEAILPELVEKFLVVHLTGAGKKVAFNHRNYKQFEFVAEGLADIFAAADFVVSRAGANSIFETLALRKPMLLIPLEIATRGDQVLNANYFCKMGWALMQNETSMTSDHLKSKIGELVANGQAIVEQQNATAPKNAISEIVHVLEKVS